jgi:glycogen synthase
MKILFLTNFYPPHEVGGQEQSCEQMARALESRGHRIHVLTSDHGVKWGDPPEPGVSRALRLEMDLAPLRNAWSFFFSRKNREEKCFDELRRVIDTFQPEIVFIWGMWNLPRRLPVLAEKLLPGRVVYRFAEYWPTLPTQHELYWQTPGRNWCMGALKRLLSVLARFQLKRESPCPPLKFERAFCVSATTRKVLLDAGVPVQDSKVIYTGLDLRRFPVRSAEVGCDHRPLRLLFVGRLAPQKGIETAVKALASPMLQHKEQLTLTLVGSGTPAYERHLKALIRELELAGRVKLMGRVPRETIPLLLQQYDVLVVPSIWEEPLARVVLEGMAAGLVVIASRMGGTPEMITDGANGLLFEPDDPEDLAEKIQQVLRSPELRSELTAAARDTVESSFTLAAMTDKVEEFLNETLLLAANGPGGTEAAT